MFPYCSTEMIFARGKKAYDLLKIGVFEASTQ
jgi:hypothetical protein